MGIVVRSVGFRSGDGTFPQSPIPNPDIHMWMGPVSSLLSIASTRAPLLTALPVVIGFMLT